VGRDRVAKRERERERNRVNDREERNTSITSNATLLQIFHLKK